MKMFRCTGMIYVKHKIEDFDGTYLPNVPEKITEPCGEVLELVQSCVAIKIIGETHIDDFPSRGNTLPGLSLLSKMDLLNLKKMIQMRYVYLALHETPRLMFCILI